MLRSGPAPLGFTTRSRWWCGGTRRRCGRSPTWRSTRANGAPASATSSRSEPRGTPGLARIYGLEFAEIRIMDLGLLYRALVDQQVDVVAGNATDGQIESLRRKVLVDDRGYFPPYEAAPVVRRVVLERYPKLAAALEGLGGRISVEGMRRMNYEVDGKHRAPSEVVRELHTAS